MWSAASGTRSRWARTPGDTSTTRRLPGRGPRDPPSRLDLERVPRGDEDRSTEKTGIGGRWRVHGIMTTWRSGCARRAASSTPRTASSGFDRGPAREVLQRGQGVARREGGPAGREGRADQAEARARDGPRSPATSPGTDFMSPATTPADQGRAQARPGAQRQPQRLGQYLKPAMLLSGSAKTEHAEAAAKLISFMVNDPDVGRDLRRQPRPARHQRPARGRQPRRAAGRRRGRVRGRS